jgi:hypothetical protein
VAIVGQGVTVVYSQNNSIMYTQFLIKWRALNVEVAGT